MIVTPEGLNVFPEDVERVLNPQPGVRESAVVGVRDRSANERVHAVLVLDPGVDADAVVRGANAELADHQKIRRALGLAGAGAAAHRRHAEAEARGDSRVGASRRRARRRARAGGDALAALVAKYAGRADLSAADDARRARAELARARRADGGARGRVSDAHRRRRVRRARATSRSCARSSSRRRPSDAPPAEPVDFPTWNRIVAGADDPPRQPADVDPAARARRSRGSASRASSTSSAIDGPVIFAANHQSHIDAPVILAALPGALALPRRAGDGQGVLQGALLSRAVQRARAWFTNSLNYYLAALFFNAFPLPQREAGARQTLRYIGEVLERRLLGADLSRGRRTADGRDRPRSGRASA